MMEMLLEETNGTANLYSYRWGYFLSREMKLPQVFRAGTHLDDGGSSTASHIVGGTVTMAIQNTKKRVHSGKNAIILAEDCAAHTSNLLAFNEHLFKDPHFRFQVLEEGGGRVRAGARWPPCPPGRYSYSGRQRWVGWRGDGVMGWRRKPWEGIIYICIYIYRSQTPHSQWSCRLYGRIVVHEERFTPPAYRHPLHYWLFWPHTHTSYTYTSRPK